MNNVILLLSNLRPDFNLYWVSFVVLFSIILLAYVKQNNNAILISFKSFFNFRFFRQSIREETNTSRLFSRILLIHSFIIIAVVLNYFFVGLLTNKYEIKDMKAFFILIVLVFCLYLVNLLVKKIIAKISNTRIVEREAEKYDQFFFQVLGIMLLPGVIGLYFFPTKILGLDVLFMLENYIKIIIIALLLNKIIQSIFQSFEIKISWVYIFLYICTLEILPLCVGFQLLVD